MKRLPALIAGLMLSALSLTAGHPVKVACIGNSITYGMTIPDRETMCYPAQLSRMLGEGYEVANFGHSGATLLRRGHRPYTSLEEWREAKAFAPDIAVIHLGVNDTDPRDWPHYGDDFVSDYKAIIDTLRMINPQTKIYIARLSPISATHYRFPTGTRDWRIAVNHAIERVANATGTTLIDFDTPLRHRQHLMPDGLHPSAEGSRYLAETVYKAITGRHGPLRLPEVMQSGIVVQRDRHLPVSGVADAFSPITVSIGGATYRTSADANGQWSVITAPLATGPAYTLTVTDSRDTIKLTDIQAGELWIASGQSNMAFPLNAAAGAKDFIATSRDSLLRFYDMRPRAMTNDVEWPDSIIRHIDNLNYFLPAGWQEATPDNTGEISAIAYLFGRELRDSLQVPVGLIINSVGGSTTESWVDISTLEREMPGILVNWLGNDYVQPWAQDRARRNLGSHTSSLHPYRPDYLFSSAIDPLKPLAPAGVIWYQGESNAHNTDLHARLFPMLVNSWRQHFDNPMLPFYFVQLSSIDRPSWPEFRNSQRCLADEIPGVYMAVSSDYGDSLDVHPRDKAPVAHRLVRQALNHQYNFSHVTPCGPEPLSARLIGPGTVAVTFDNGQGMRAASGSAIRGFELAETDGLYFPADVISINPSELIIKSMKINNPTMVRYAWQPFTRANLVNSDSLPAGTFKMAVDQGDFSLEPEAGMEYGVSAPYAGMSDGRLIIAGGCNFPCADPLAPDAAKKFYRGIYAADTATLQWRRIGSLPHAMAYGATAPVSGGLLLIGGTSETGPTADVTLLTLEGPESKVTLTPMPALPVPVDNMAAATIGRTVYVAGGNITTDGVTTPSRHLYALDLSRENPRWEKLKSMPGNPRVQPAMTAARDAAGNECLWIWGGFAPRHDGHEPSLETAGLCYRPDTNRWMAVAAPEDADGLPISTGGGAAVTLADGRIAVAGGVNARVFLDALRCQAPDYLLHPIEWYGLNPHVMVFDPSTLGWSEAMTTPEAARAGAAVFAGNHNDLFIYGGELKPRVRTASTIHLTDL